MTLTLEICTPGGIKPGVVGRCVFDEDGGTIGRAVKSSWVLPDSKISGRHALISWRSGVFYIEDVSVNGTCLNSADNRLAPSRPYPLKAGDRIFIRPYEIRVSITDARGNRTGQPADEWPADPRGRAGFDTPDPFAVEDPFGIASSQRAEAPGVDPAGPPFEGSTAEKLDLDRFLKPVRKPPPPRTAPSAKDLERGSPYESHFQPARVRPVPPPHANPDIPPVNYNPLDESSGSLEPTVPPAPEPVAAAPPPARKRRPDSSTPRGDPPGASDPSAPPVESSPPADGSDDWRSGLARMLEGAGLKATDVTPELARDFGQILRVVVAGVMDMLQARQQIKDEFQIQATHFRPTDNNPLKHSANVDDALHNLLVKRNAAYLGPVDAFADAFDDLRNHQMAILAGMRVAFEAMLAEFDPAQLQAQFDRQLEKRLLLSIPAKLRYWDLYRDRLGSLAADPETSFRRLFGESFARAYEEQLQQLKAEHADRTTKRPPGGPSSTEP